MISHSHKFIFIHIPKTGGTTVESLLKDYGVLLQGRGNFHSIYFKHIPTEKLETMMGDEYQRYFKFSFVRNPWDWLISIYEFCRGFAYPFLYDSEFSSLKVPVEYQNMPFEQWLRWFHETFNMQQSDIISNSKGGLSVDRVFRYENLKTDIEELGAELGLSLKQNIPRLKASNRKPLDHYYNSGKSVDLVQKYFSKDIERFGYKFDDLL